MSTSYRVLVLGICIHVGTRLVAQGVELWFPMLVRRDIFATGILALHNLIMSTQHEGWHLQHQVMHSRARNVLPVILVNFPYFNYILLLLTCCSTWPAL